MNFPKISFAATCILLGTSSPAISDSGEGFKLFSDSLLYAQIRPRFEYADTDGGADAARALTNRTVLGAKFSNALNQRGLEATLEATDVSHFGIVDDYAPEQKGYDVIMDPTQTRITQANLTYKIGKTTLIAGRKMATFDNQRFIGHVGWRQMPQTYDLFLVTNQDVKNLTLSAAYVKRVNRITENGKLDTKSVLVNGSYAVNPALKLTTYGYMLASIHDSFGIRATGSTKLPNVKLSYEAEYAFQNKPMLNEESMGDAIPDHEAQYYKLALKANTRGFTFGAAYEVLGEKEGNAGGAFGTPLATLHAMNGFADRFLATPVKGLVDTNFTLGYANKQIGKFFAFYHLFESDNGGDDYGSEFDLVYVRKFNKNLNMFVKSAFYSEGDDLRNGDTTKFWLMLDYKFGF
jgi:hypothetical protein